jgi:adenylyltransferase/sulfurtransferase
VNLSDEELERYARQIILPQIGGTGQRKLKESKVAVVGAGGIGSAVVPALAGAGIGLLTIIDSDVVELANLHRQPLFREVDEGKPKADVAAGFAERLNRFVQVRPRRDRLDRDNAEPLLAGHDLVIDGSDNFATRLAVSDCCVGLGVPLISAAAVQLQGQVGVFRRQPCYRCFVGEAFDADDCDTCAEMGVVGALTATMGSFAALLAINAIAGSGEPQPGLLHLLDGERLQWRSIRIPADPTCRACASG